MKIRQILKQRLQRIWNSFANSESHVHEAIIENDLAFADTSYLEKSNQLGLKPRELAILLNRKEWFPLLHIPNTHTIKVVPKGEHIVKKLSLQEFQKQFGIPYLSHTIFTSYDQLKIIGQQCPWIYRLGLVGMERDPLYDYFRDQIAHGAVADITIAWIDSILGYGAFANENMVQGTFVGVYTGVIRPVSRSAPELNEYCLHYPSKYWSRQVFVIDAALGGNEIRFVNHSDTPNLSLECLLDRGLLHFFLRANQPICKGAHLTFNYGDAFWQYRRKA